MLNQDQHKRYERHILMPEIGHEGQLKLTQSSVLIIGAGGLGSPIAYYLCAAGVGHIGIIDNDVVDFSNLQRQILHSSADIGRKKALSAQEKLQLLNPDVRVTALCDKFTSANASQLIEPYDFIIDATDNFSSKFIINDECVKAGKAFSIGAIFRFEGQVFTHIPGTACYRCIFDSIPECDNAIGPISTIPGIVGSIQATEAIKYLLGHGNLLTNTLLTIDSSSMEFMKIKLSPRKECQCDSLAHQCNKRP